MTVWFPFGLAATLLVFGLLVHVGKVYVLISGYNTMSRARKEKVDIQGLARLMGVWAYANAALLSLVGVLLALGVPVGTGTLLVLFGVSFVFLLIRAQRYDGNVVDEHGRIRPGARRHLVVLGAVLGVLALAIGAFLFVLSRPVDIAVTDDGVAISGLYGITLDWDTITEVELVNELPTIELRTNGSAVGSHLRGHFRTTEYGQVQLFVNAGVSPFILVESDGEVVIMNRPVPEETEELFGEIQEALRGGEVALARSRVDVCAAVGRPADSGLEPTPRDAGCGEPHRGAPGTPEIAAIKLPEER